MAFSQIVLLLSTIQASSCFYLPGVSPQEFVEGDRVDLKVTTLTSTKTQLPYEHYYFPFCQPDNVEYSAENLGEVLRGDRILNSGYELKLNVEMACKLLCKKTYTEEQSKLLKYGVENDYRVHWIVDNLPSAMKLSEQTSTGELLTIYDLGHPMGFKGGAEVPGSVDGTLYLNNHVRITIKYHKDESSFNGARIVGFEIEPYSVKHKSTDASKQSSCTDLNAQDMTLQEVPTSGDVSWTYDVKWEFSPIKWASRWDLYLYMGDEQIHWFSIINSLMIVLFLSGMVAMIMMRTLHRDFNRYNQVETDEEEETGWKLVHGDVFRPPTYPSLLCSLVGTGIQIMGMTAVTMAFAVFGFLSPANRGGLMTAVLLLFVFMGMLAGLYSAYLYRALKGQDWKKNTLLTAMLIPGFVFFVFFVLNFFIWGEKSSGAVPFGTLIALLALWFGISVPLVFVGSYFGYKKEPVVPPVRVNQIPRVVPEQTWYMKPFFSILVGGVLPFGAVFIELFFILSSIWLHQFYYVFGFLLMVFIILFITCAEITVVMCYFQLCAEDWHWWWRSFLTSGSSALYLFLYSIFYFCTKLEMDNFVSGLLYFGYMLIASVLFFLFTGTIGFYACYWFVWKIYGAVKVD